MKLPRHITKKEIIRRDGLFYHPTFIKKAERAEILDWLKTLHPIWEMRYSDHNPPPEGDTQRQLLRPVYWLGNWQFACLNYYHPPKGIVNRCVLAEGYNPLLKKLLETIEGITRAQFPKKDIPKNWTLNTCLINFYGSSIDPVTQKKKDTARVGDHKDFEPGPVASLSFGERAFFQFVLGRKDLKNNILHEQWLDDSSLLIFGGDTLKDRAFHRVQRVENKLKSSIDLNVEHFETRRINFTFRYVPKEHIVAYHLLPDELKSDIHPYMQELAKHSLFFKNELEK
ncbi:MAG: alpha-ketoglutarate-dependent dioxygenase AlkB [Bacteriovorax sp.]|jgi:alkylated DNA repair protein (DNA oxidative demethylase)|nr:alpha-ketoglutarate-dependent dioxygenase AlkB [Bacteriovorax sp.]